MFRTAIALYKQNFCITIDSLSDPFRLGHLLFFFFLHVIMQISNEGM